MLVARFQKLHAFLAYQIAALTLGETARNAVPVSLFYLVPVTSILSLVEFSFFDSLEDTDRI